MEGWEEWKQAATVPGWDGLMGQVRDGQVRGWIVNRKRAGATRWCEKQTKEVDWLWLAGGHEQYRLAKSGKGKKGRR